MLRPLERHEFDTYIDFAYSLALDLSKSAYPTYCDGIKTKADFVRVALKSFDREHEEILLFERDGTVEGWIHYYALPEDRYVQIYVFNVRSHGAAAVDETVAYLSRKYSDHALYFGLPAQNETVCSRLEHLGFAKEEESYVDVLRFADYDGPEPAHGTVRVSRENFSEFARLHQVHDEDMYWNNERLLKDIDNWSIFLLYERGQAVGAILFCYADRFMEIFGVDYAGNQFHSGTFRKLLTRGLHEGKNAGMGHLVFFTEEQEHPIAVELGFTLISKYVLYVKEI